jgi:hypothetical protein
MNQVLKLSAMLEVSQTVNVQHIVILTQLCGCKTWTVKRARVIQNAAAEITHLRETSKYVLLDHKRNRIILK